MLAAQAAVGAERGGYTLYQPNPSSLVVLPAAQELSFDLSRDIVPIGLLGQKPFLIAVVPSLGVNTVGTDRIGQETSGRKHVFGNGSRLDADLTGELFRTKAAIDLTYVPYPSTAQSLADIMGGWISMIVDSWKTSISSFRSAILLPHKKPND